MQFSFKKTDSEKVRDGTSPSRPCLFDLPLEIRVPIYFLVIRPDCMYGCTKHHEHQSGSGTCINLMVTCSQVYLETIDILHLEPRQFRIATSSDESQVFRHSKDFLEQHLFKSNEVFHPCYLPPQMSELEFVRIRRLDMTIDLHSYSGKHCYCSKQYHRRSLQRKLSTVAKAVAKMTNCVAVTINFVLPEPTKRPNGNAMNIRTALSSLLKVFNTKGLDVAVSSKHDSEEFRRNTGLELCMVGMPHDDDLRLEGKAAEVVVQDHTSVVKEVGSVKLGIPNTCTEDFKAWRPTTEIYQLVPECRTCFMVFKSFPQLHQHLSHNDNHNTKFQVSPIQ